MCLRASAISFGWLGVLLGISLSRSLIRARLMGRVEVQ
jgi:hypothetical protein